MGPRKRWVQGPDQAAISTQRKSHLPSGGGGGICGRVIATTCGKMGEMPVACEGHLDPDTIAALARTIAEKSCGPGLAPVLDRQWAANFRRHKMGCLKKSTTQRLPSTVCDLALDNKWKRDYLDVVEQPKTTNGDVTTWIWLSSLRSMVSVSLKVTLSPCRCGHSWAYTRRPSNMHQSSAEGMLQEKNRYDTTTALTRGKPQPHLW